MSPQRVYTGKLNTLSPQMRNANQVSTRPSTLMRFDSNQSKKQIQKDPFKVPAPPQIMNNNKIQRTVVGGKQTESPMYG